MKNKVSGFDELEELIYLVKGAYQIDHLTYIQRDKLFNAVKDGHLTPAGDIQIYDID